MSNLSNKTLQAEYSRDALAKALYSRIFDWIIRSVNQALGWAPDPNYLSLGILDIYGFEIFEVTVTQRLLFNF